MLNLPEFTGITGRDCLVVDLDATGQERLWEIAIGQTVKCRDIHDSNCQRRAFLRDVLSLQAVQTSPHVNRYSCIGSKNFDANVGLIRVERMRAVSQEGAWDEWLTLFVEGLRSHPRAVLMFKELNASR